MEQLLIVTLIFAVATTILIVPMSKKLAKGELTNSQLVKTSTFVLLSSMIACLAIIYLMKIDMHWTIFAFALPVITFIGMLVTAGFEQKLKGFVFLASLIVLAYMLTAPVFNANEKYESAKMEEKVEIEPFDETQTPASVPPRFAENKMKKAFGQVPNTSYYELGNLQIQKVNGEYVYIAPVEFSNFLNG